MQNIRFRQDSNSLIQTLWGFCLTVLVVLGIGGTLYKLLAPSGWIANYLGSSFSGGAVTIGLLLLFGALGYLVRAATSTRQQSSIADVVVYAFAFAGLVYAMRYWSKGIF